MLCLCFGSRAVTGCLHDRNPWVAFTTSKRHHSREVCLAYTAAAADIAAPADSAAADSAATDNLVLTMLLLSLLLLLTTLLLRLLLTQLLLTKLLLIVPGDNAAECTSGDRANELVGEAEHRARGEYERCGARDGVHQAYT